MKNITINNVPFELVNVTTETPIRYHDLYLAYDRPSDAKRAIFQDWFEFWAQFEERESFGIASRNCFMFTITMTFKNNGKWYNAYITPTHNYINEISR